VIWALNGMFIDMIILAFVVAGMIPEESFGTPHFLAIQMIMIAIFLGVGSKIGKKDNEK